ncbi:hypothetical protein EB820_20050 [Brevibacillus agri]|uniref:Uncharacterized protein n=1 Tax=Brevibacillus agri TaxID=51101 RepID=A0A3M8AJR4_9BACL|nr:hypothetical protein [Brevibacillus agri]QAV15487.1 hypothetical protein BA6348_23675 [Brevibacillus agri]RNB51421.1 hypothetical protein EB820_20050 [Brevibacillus agri]
MITLEVTSEKKTVRRQPERSVQWKLPSRGSAQNFWKNRPLELGLKGGLFLFGQGNYQPDQSDQEHILLNSSENNKKLSI